MTAVVEHIRGKTFHQRRGRVAHKLAHTVDYVLFDAEAQELKAPGWFGRVPGKPMAVLDSDHGGPKGQGRGAAWVREVLKARDLFAIRGKIELMTLPRVLGHEFNPVSFWLCHDTEDQLRAVIAEVNNTFGDRHCYLCCHPDQRPIEPSDILTATKILHVSPFLPIAGGYRFRFDIRPDKVGIWIDYSADAEEGLYATLTGPRRPLSRWSMLKSALRRPFGSRRVLVLIHWHALVLFLKGAKYRARPEPPAEELS
ncbi:DUF1365 domain-containing protein [Rhodovulum sulfidophilum]|uniref:DUF1365 domain-containing protein n=1 Tax=Rhodovulum sulfidophilum TaxID=35806 RepID=UPI0005A9D2D8|nr:DUF1365 domain-containing protein [Rhodovulum sulfidophilum]ANB33007.1 cyclopropane-fatty-acyl-phospholipid synthase [Rhodovulum sulfidophilum DSM 1374]ANB36855.1 cyclopropane-fatty-acyl-phospholipid synthase [Rhodovulum sulfidophilum]MBL3584252.1 DUF1365 domain-containing protein [Rhodovulum sulfidophilum]MBL3594947.1 DUF1365 domain-containing protein [Rhodovulum sulfidophilum]MCW2302594.1 DUF1365 family protein [Rhodovulum sulfidophilum]